MAVGKAGRTNWFAIWISVAAVVVIVAVGAVVIFANNAASGPGTQPTASNINTETGAIAVGSGEDSVDTYVDFMCPICGSFESTYGETLAGLAEDGTITLNIHPISILDRLSAGTDYSTRAANAMYAVAATYPDLALPYLQALFASQPAENTAGLSNDELISMADGIGATGLEADINDGTYAQFVTYITQQTPLQPGQQGIATPTISINGETISNSELTGDPEADFVSKFAG